MNMRVFAIFCRDLVSITLAGWLLYLSCKFGLRVAQYFLSIDLMNEFDKSAMATIAALVFIVLIIVVSVRNKN